MRHWETADELCRTTDGIPHVLLGGLPAHGGLVPAIGFGDDPLTVLANHSANRWRVIVTSLLPQFQADAIEALRTVFAPSPELETAAALVATCDQLPAELVSSVATSWPGSALELVESIVSLSATRQDVLATELRTWSYLPSTLLLAALKVHHGAASPADQSAARAIA